MTTITPPRAGVAIGWAYVNGQRVKVEVDPEYLRFFYTIFLRQGGVVGQSTTDLETSQFEDAGIAEMQAEMMAIRDALAQSPPIQAPIYPEQVDNLAELREGLRELQVRFDGMEQS